MGCDPLCRSWRGERLTPIRPGAGDESAAHTSGAGATSSAASAARASVHASRLED